MVRCADGSLYTGLAKDPEERARVHNAGKGAKYTRSRLPVSLVYVESCESLSAALKRERQLKPWTHANKEALISGAHVIMAKHRIYSTSVGSVYPHYLAKAEKQGRSKAEVDAIIRWLTGYSQAELDGRLNDRTDFETFFAEAPKLNPARSAITGVICGVRIEDIEEPTMREIRYLDKMVDELAKGKTMDKILRKP